MGSTKTASRMGRAVALAASALFAAFLCALLTCTSATQALAADSTGLGGGSLTRMTALDAAMNAKAKITFTNGKITITWGKVAGAAKYKVYANYCGKEVCKLVKTVKAGTTKATITKLKGSKIKKNKAVKACVAAYDASGNRIAATLGYHVGGTAFKKLSNAKKITVNKTAVFLAWNGQATVKATVTKAKPKRKLLGTGHVTANVRWMSLDGSIATVSQSGTIKAVSPGTTYVYAITANGKKASVKIVVDKKPVAAPAPMPGLVYTGEEQTGVEAGTGYTITGNTATNAGTYTATATLEKGYKWDDGTTADKTISWEISKATLTASPVIEEGAVYTGQAPDVPCEVTGFVNDETEETAAGYVAPTVTHSNIDAGTYTVTPAGGEADNYAFEYTEGELTIQPAEVEATFTASNKAYDGTTTATVAAKAETGVEGETLSITGATGTFASANAGEGIAVTVNTAGCTATVTGGQAKASNYNITYNTEGVTANITKVELTATAESPSVTYSGYVPSVGCQVTGFVNGETATTAAGYVAPKVTTTAVDAGTYTVTPAAGQATNYTFKYVSGTLTITKKKITLTYSAKDKDYDGTATATVKSEKTTIMGATGEYFNVNDDAEGQFVDASGNASADVAYDSKGNVTVKSVKVTKSATLAVSATSPNAKLSNYEVVTDSIADAVAYIKPVSIASDALSVTLASNVYILDTTGTSLPKVNSSSVTHGSLTLAQGADFDLAYADAEGNAVSTTSGISKNGTYYITATGKGNYKDTTTQKASFQVGWMYLGWGKIATYADTIATLSGTDLTAYTDRYGFTYSGKIPANETKDVEVDGSTYQVRILGFAHDSLADDSTGKAGITFGFTSAVENDFMMAAEGQQGGWKGSRVRSSIGELAKKLPSALQAQLVEVSKMTNNQGYVTEAEDASCAAISATTDTLWLPSVREVFGLNVYPEDDTTHPFTYQSEGTQYQYFTDNTGATAMTSGAWWLRSPEAAFGRYFCSVDADGAIDASISNEAELGIAPCFCIGSAVAESGDWTTMSWTEIKKVANKIAAASTTDEAYEIAKNYSMMDGDGLLIGTHSVSISTNGTVIDGTVHIVDLNHDDLADGTGKAGITFEITTKDIHKKVEYGRMNRNKTNAGGWEESYMRNTTLKDLVLGLDGVSPVEVTKMTNNQGGSENLTDRDTAVTATTDTIWLPSTAEMLGNGKFGSEETDEDVALYAKEGTQYKRYADGNDVVNSEYESIWTRSAWVRENLPDHLAIGDQLFCITNMKTRGSHYADGDGYNDASIYPMFAL